jgi:hypothetical protein
MSPFTNEIIIFINYIISAVNYCRPDHTIVSATFQGNIPEGRVETWVLALSVIGGILLLMMLVTGLIKVNINTFMIVSQKQSLN